MAMSSQVTLRGLLGLGDGPAALQDSALIMIDCQNTYRRGVMQLEGAEDFSTALNNKNIQIWQDGHFGGLKKLAHGKLCFDEPVFIGWHLCTTF